MFSILHSLILIIKLSKDCENFNWHQAYKVKHVIILAVIIKTS